MEIPFAQIFIETNHADKFDCTCSISSKYAEETLKDFNTVYKIRSD